MREYFRSFGRLRGLVFGWFGEASDDVHALVNTLAHTAAVREAMLTGARDETAAVGRMKAHLRRRIGCEAWRLRARHLLSRKMHVAGTGGARAAGRFGGDAEGEASRRFASFSAAAAAAQKAARSARAAAAAAAFAFD